MHASDTTRGRDATGSTVFGMFPGRRQAEAAIDGLVRAGFERDRISVAMRHDESLRDADTINEPAEGAAAGAVSGGVVGGLVGMGVPEEDARRFETRFQEGGVLVAVEAGAHASEAAAILERNSADVSGSALEPRPREFTSGELVPHGDKLRYAGPDRRRPRAGSYSGPERRQVQI